jgi:hypothetical protein
MEYLTINNKNIEYDKYLTQKELSLFSLTLKQRLRLLFLGHIFISTFQPEGFVEPEKFYLVRSKNGYFVSYPQGWERAFYAPEAIK